MKETKNVYQQVEELTQEQQDTILKVDLFAGMAIVLGVLPGIVLMIINFLAILDVSLPFEISNQMVIANFIIMSVCFAFVIGVLIFVKVKFPYYSGKKCDYIRKSRKIK